MDGDLDIGRWERYSQYRKMGRQRFRKVNEESLLNNKNTSNLMRMQLGRGRGLIKDDFTEESRN